MPSCTNFSVWIKNRNYQVEKFCNDVLNLIQYSVSEGYNHVMNIFKDVNGNWRADVKHDNDFVNEIGSAIEYYEAY
jgi:hypothetical protein